MKDQHEQLKEKAYTLQTIKTVDGKFQIKNQQLGKGSFAETYLAVDIQTGQLLACKMISKKNLLTKINASKNKTGTKEYFIMALKNQINTWKNISHQSIVMFKDFSETPNNIYFFLEFCSKGNLERHLKVKGIFKENQAIDLFIQIAKGCQYLYDKGIFHRDIKTQNILITQKGIMKISDFGFAKIITDEEMKNNPTDGTSVGTPIYMSPQVLKGQPYTIKCDVWSLGIVFYKILFNLYPWQKTQNLPALLEKMGKEIMFPPHLQISEELKNMIRGMLTVDEEERLSIKDVISRLNNFKQSMMDIE